MYLKDDGQVSEWFDKEDGRQKRRYGSNGDKDRIIFNVLCSLVIFHYCIKKLHKICYSENEKTIIFIRSIYMNKIKSIDIDSN